MFENIKTEENSNLFFNRETCYVLGCMQIEQVMGEPEVQNSAFLS